MKMLDLNGFTVESILEEYGSPLFVFSAEDIRDNLDTFREEFIKRYEKTEVAYSYKVNYLPGILEVIHQKGISAEVASGFEYRLAKELGVPGERIVFNGPFKTKEELQLAIEDGAYINVDHFEELNTLSQIARELGRTVNIGIRINTDVGINQLPDRFGFNLESGEADAVVSKCTANKLLNVTGLHIHLTSYILESQSAEDIPARGIKLIWPKGAGAYLSASKKIVNFAKSIRDKYGVETRYLDMGGGFPTVDALSPYVEAITSPILEEFEESELPLLILEPGRAIVSNAAQLITTVVAVKELPGGQGAVVADAGINILPTSLFRYQQIECIKESKGELRDTIVYGPLCLQTDIIARTKLPELSAGDKLIVKNVGSYNIPQSSTFIFGQPAVIMIDGGEIRILRNREM
jgi:diaminopimelate decarboxylase